MDNAGHFTAGQTISGFTEPYGLAWDHKNGKSLLYVSDAGTGKIRAFDVSGTPTDANATQFDHLGLMTGPGKVDDEHFGWQLDTVSAMKHGASIAVSPDGTTLAVTDIWNERTLFFDTTTGTARTDERFGGVFNPSPDVDNGVLAFNGSQYVVFTKHTNGDAADNLLTPKDKDSVSLWLRTSTSGVLLGTQDEGMTVTAPERPTHHDPHAAAPVLYVDSDGFLHGGGTSPQCPGAVGTTKVTDNAWHNVVLTRTANDTALYVDGASPIHTTCAPAGQPLTVLGDGFTSSGHVAWPGTTGGYMGFTGAIDDVRVYHKLLTADDVKVLAAPTQPSPVFADWKFDEKAGSTTFRDSAAEHDLTTDRATRLANEPGLHFTGDEAQQGGTLPVIAGRSVTTTAPETITVRVRVPVGGAGGPVLGEQNGRYPISVTYPYIDGSPASATAISVVNGAVHSYVMDNPLNSSCVIADGQWHTIAVTSSVSPDGTIFHNTLYVSGCDSVSNDSNQGPNASAHTDMQFGAARVDPTTGDGLSNWQYFAGDIGEAQVYQRVLSQQELNGLGVLPPR